MELMTQAAVLTAFDERSTPAVITDRMVGAARSAAHREPQRLKLRSARGPPGQRQRRAGPNLRGARCEQSEFASKGGGGPLVEAPV